jgi:hypothetical protein
MVYRELNSIKEPLTHFPFPILHLSFVIVAPRSSGNNK